MGRLRRIEQLVNSTVNHYSHVKIYPRSLPNFVDSLLRGIIRFGKRTGNSIATINPDNTFELSEAPVIRTRQLKLSRPSEWINLGSIISLGPGKEMHRIYDIIDNELILENKMERTYTLNDRILLIAHPIEVSITAPYGSTSVTVKSQYLLGNGDVFSYLSTESLLQSLTDIKVVKAVYLGTTPDPVYTKLYRLDLQTNIERELLSNSIVYIRAYPAYFSSPIRVPNALFTSDPIGPFLIDILSGKLLEGGSFKETLSLKTTNRAGEYILGNVSEYVKVEKNYIVAERPWAAHFPMFWALAEGTTRISPNKFHMRVNTKNLFNIGLRCVPPLLLAGKKWRINLHSNDDCTIRFYFYPNPPQEFSLISGSNKSILLSVPNPSNPITQLEINIFSSSSICEVTMSDWTPAKDTAIQMEYSLVVEAIGQATYQSTGLIIKPYFLGSEFLKTSWDSGSISDGGKVFF